jgi:hypothetical protein
VSRSGPSKKSRAEKQETTATPPAKDGEAEEIGSTNTAANTASDDTQPQPLDSGEPEQDGELSPQSEGAPKVEKEHDAKTHQNALGLPDDATHHVENNTQTSSQSRAETAVIDKPVTPKRRGSSVMGLLGFVIAGLLVALVSFGAAQYSSGHWPFAARPGDREWRAGLEAQIAKQSQQMSAVRTDLASQDTGAALDGLQSQLDSLRPVVTDVAALQVEIELLQNAQDGVVDQLELIETKLAHQPVSDGVSASVVDRQTRVLKQMQTQISAQKTAFSELRTELLETQQLVKAAALKTATQSSILQLIGALESGAPFAFAIAEFANDVGVLPQALLAAAPYGVPTTAALARDFADQARAALTVARKTGSETPENAGNISGAGRLSNFLQNQLGMRSVTPRQGNDPDAVLSRAEAAIEAGQVAETLTILTALPPAAHTSMASWIERAELRRAAQSAVASLSAQLLKD